MTATTWCLPSRRDLRWLAPLVGAFFSCPPPAVAAFQEGAEPPIPEFVTGVPESPAFQFLNTTPSTIARPGTLRDLALALINSVGPDGALTAGFALEATPWQLIPGFSVPLADYQSDWMSYLLSNTQISIGSVQRGGDDPATELALGARLTLFDQADPMRDASFTRSLGDALLSCISQGGPEQDDAEALECGIQEVNTRFEAYTRERWNAARLSVAFATGQRFPDAVFGDRESSGGQAWAVGGYPLGSRGQLIGQIEYRTHPGRETLARRSTVAFGTRLLVGSARTNAFVELIGQHTSSTEDALDTSRSLWSAGLELRIASNTWISTGFGRRYDELAGTDRTMVLANLRWGLNSRNRLNELRTAVPD